MMTVDVSEDEPTDEKVVDLSEEAPSRLDVEMPNLLLGLMGSVQGQEFVQGHVDTILADMEQAEEDRKQYMEERGELYKLFAGRTHAMKPPYQSLMLPIVPIVAQTLNRTWPRLYDQVVPQRGDVASPMATGFEDEAGAAEVAKHMNFNLRQNMPEWARTMRQTCVEWGFGCTYRRTFYSPTLHRVTARHVAVEDVYRAWTERSYMPDMSDLPWVGLMLHVTPVELQDLERAGTYVKIERTREQPEPKRDATTDARQEIDGTKLPKHKLTRDFYEWHGWLTLPGQDRLQAVLVTIDVLEKKAVAIQVREQDDPKDLLRYASEKKAADIRAAARRLAAQVPTATELPQPGEQTDATMPSMAEGPPDTTLPAAPSEPEPAEEVEPPRQVPIFFLVRIGAIPNPAGAYDLGLAHMVLSSNRLANDIFGLAIGGAYSASTVKGIMSEDSPWSGDLTIEPGKFIRAKGVASHQLKDMFFPFPTEQPHQDLLKVVETLKLDSEAVTNTPQILSGVGRDRQTATGAKIELSQALTPMMVLTRCFLEDLKYEMRHLARLFSIYTTDEEWYAVVAPDKQVKEPGAARAAYLNCYDWEFRAEGRSSSRPERVEEASMVLQAVMQMPPPMQNPALLIAAYDGFFRAIDRPDIAEQLTFVPPPVMAPGATDSTGEKPPGESKGKPDVPIPGSEAVSDAGQKMISDMGSFNLARRS